MRKRGIKELCAFGTTMLVTGLILSACAFSKPADSPAENKESAKTARKAATQNAEDKSLAALRSEITAEGQCCAVIDLGYLDPNIQDRNLTGYNQYANMLSKYPFLSNISADRIVGSEGSDSNAFCIVLAGNDDLVDIYLTDGPGEDGVLARQEKIYSGRKGEPVIVRCVVGDLFSNVLISVTGSHGAIVDYNPMYSGKDGSLIVTDSKGNVLFLAK